MTLAVDMTGTSKIVTDEVGSPTQNKDATLRKRKNEPLSASLLSTATPSPMVEKHVVDAQAHMLD